MSEITTIRISLKLREKLKDRGARLGETYEDVIWRLIKKVEENE